MADGKGNEQVEKHLHCPECGAGHKLLTRQYDGSFLCLRCNHEWYPRPRFSIREEGAPYLGERIRNFIDLARPATMLPAGIAGACLVWLGSILSSASFSLLLALVVGILLGLVQAGGQILNQSSRFEVRLDRKNDKDYRPIVRGAVGVDEGKLFGLAVLSGAVGFSFAVSLWFGALAAIIAAFGVFYTYGPSLKYRFLLNNFSQGFSRGSLPFLIPYTLFGIKSLVPLGLAIVGGILVSCIQTVKDVPDLDGDRELSVPTLPVRLGMNGAKRTMLIIAIFAFGALPSLILAGILPLSLAVLLTLAAPTGWLIHTLDNPIEFKYIENSVNWGVFYATVAALYILPPVLLMG